MSTDTTAQPLRTAAQAVLDRWDSPKWEWQSHGPTADLMADLRKALAASPQPAVGAQVERGVGPLHPKRVQLSRTKGWRMPENTVKVDRTTRYGNPFRDSEHDQHGEASIELANGIRQIVDDWWTAPVVVRLFEQWMTGALIQEPSFLEPRSLVDRKGLRPVPDLAPLRGKNLACWCKPGSACHADVLLRLANHERHNVLGKAGP